MKTCTNSSLIAFEKHLLEKNLSDSTIRCYLWATNYFLERYEIINKQNLLDYREYLIMSFKHQTVNTRLQAINQYLDFIDNSALKLKFIKNQQRNFLENVISHEEYIYFKTCLKKEENLEWYYIVWLIATTGTRISELLQFQVKDIKLGYMDLYSKGGKLRRIFIPKDIKTDILSWLLSINITTGQIFLNRYGLPISARGIAQQLKILANKYGIDTKVIYPHSFRHLFAKNFLTKCSDLSLLADLMGHSSIETTRIYLRRSAKEQYNLINKIVTW